MESKKVSKEEVREQESLKTEAVAHEDKKESHEDITPAKVKKAKPGKHVEKEIETLQTKLDEINDKYLRLYSEFDNFRKRTLKEKIEFSKTASADVISSLLPVLDDCERAKKSLEESKDTDAIKEGMKLIYNKLLGILQQKGLEEMKSVGEVFDTDLHEAVTNLPAASEEQKGRIIDEIEKGYFLNGKVIRFAKVVVGN